MELESSPVAVPQLLSEEPILLIDTSYVSFYRYYATINWYKLSHQEEIISDTYKWFENAEFMDKFSKRYHDTIEKLQKKFKVPNGNCIFAKDCSRKDIWRTGLFPAYKAQREINYALDTWQGGAVLQYAHQELVPILCQDNGYYSISETGAEGDDIIGCLTKHLRTKYPTQSVIIITNDCDFLQLADEYTQIINLQNKIINLKSCGCPKMDLEIKILMGDVSDNIPRCFKRCGIKTATKYAKNKELLEKAFLKEEGSRDKYEMNKTLIDMNNIPSEIQGKILKSFAPILVQIEIDAAKVLEAKVLEAKVLKAKVSKAKV